MRLALVVLCLLSTPVCLLGAAENKAVPPADIGEALEPIIEKHGVPGMAAAVVKGGRVTHLGVAGVRRAGGKEKITAEDRFHIGSCTKAMTATLCAVLVEEGKLSWGMTLGEAFPDARQKMLPEWRGVTLEQLLNNAGGMPEKTHQTDLWGRLHAHRGTAMSARRMMLETVTSVPPEAAPGTKFIYSNAGFTVAGHMAEVVMKRPYEQLLRERIFKPLVMNSAGFGPPGRAGVMDQPRGHIEAGESVEPGPRADNPPAIAPAGTVHCTVGDWAKFAAFHLKGARGEATEGPKLKAETWKKLHTAEGEHPYVMGWLPVGTKEGGVLTHAGSNTMWHAIVVIIPKQDLAVVVACNKGGDAAETACQDAIAAVRAAARPMQ
jgi:CubicO group peptidase (beta-lactamase class C family)